MVELLIAGEAHAPRKPGSRLRFAPSAMTFGTKDAGITSVSTLTGASATAKTAAMIVCRGVKLQKSVALVLL